MVEVGFDLATGIPVSSYTLPVAGAETGRSVIAPVSVGGVGMAGRVRSRPAGSVIGAPDVLSKSWTRTVASSVKVASKPETLPPGGNCCATGVVPTGSRTWLGIGSNWMLHVPATALVKLNVPPGLAGAGPAAAAGVAERGAPSGSVARTMFVPYLGVAVVWMVTLPFTVPGLGGVSSIPKPVPSTVSVNTLAFVPVEGTTREVSLIVTGTDAGMKFAVVKL